jgi:dCTP deaminase
MKSWQDIEPGVLVDFEIKKLCQAGILITKNYDEKFIKQTCYEIRAGEIAWYTYKREPPFRKVSIKNQGGVYLPPKGYVTIITMEELEFPVDCIGRIMTKGQLFSIGISAVNTYVDPGFSGPLGITLMNHSSKPIFIPVGEPIAKIEFTKLTKAVGDPYKGRHLQGGDLWPIPDSYYNIPPSIDTTKYPDELKDPIIRKIENTKYTIRALSIIIIPLIISSILFWILNWRSLTLTVRSVGIIISGVIAILAIIAKWWESLSRFLKLFKKDNGDEYSL